MYLITDILFPSRYAKWRIEGIKTLIDELKADVLVRKVDSYAGINYDVDYDEMKEYFDLSKFNIIIFDPKYNYLNKYNTRIDGTKFNGKAKYSYLFTTKNDFDIKNYSRVFHIFLSSFTKFNEDFKFDHASQYVHLYPGGGYANKASILALSKNVNIISTQPFCTKHLTELKYTNFIEAYGSTCLPINHTPKYKVLNTEKLRICFSNMGNPIQKGSAVYTQIVTTYKKLNPTHDIEFMFVGSNYGQPINPAITYIDKMSQHDLDVFYNETIDILINMENGIALNGWPLGIEAALQGVVLITTDTHNANTHFKYSKDAMVICKQNDINVILNSIKQLYLDRNKLNEMSNEIQNHSIKHFSYDIQQRKIINYIKSHKLTPVEKNYRSFCPQFSAENDIFSLNKDTFTFTDDSFISLTPNIIDYMVSNIESDTPFTMVRYNDGEWIASLRIENNNLYKIHYPKWGEDGQKFVDDYILPIIKEKPNYLIGIASEVLKKPYMMEHIYEHIKNINLFDGGLFARMSLTDSLYNVLEKISEKPTILIGPKYLQPICDKFNFTHITVPETNIWNHYSELQTNLNYSIEYNSPKVILYSCSFVAKKLIHEMYSKYNNTITQIDVGAALDPLCGIHTRPWHKFIKRLI